jgi:hypothetical protein
MLLRRIQTGALLMFSLAVQLISIFNYAIWDLYVFYIPSYVLLSLLSIAGMGEVVNLGTAAIRKLISTTPIRWTKNLIEGTVAIMVLVFSLWPVFQPQKEAVITGEVMFKFDEYPVYDEFTLNISRAMVVKLPENAIVFSDWDMMWPYYYAAHIIDDRADLTFHETYPADDMDGIAESVADYVLDNLDEHPIFFSAREQDLLDAGFKFIPARAGPVRLVRILDE